MPTFPADAAPPLPDPLDAAAVEAVILIEQRFLIDIPWDEMLLHPFFLVLHPMPGGTVAPEMSAPLHGDPETVLATLAEAESGLDRPGNAAPIVGVVLLVETRDRDGRVDGRRAWCELVSGAAFELVRARDRDPDPEVLPYPAEGTERMPGAIAAHLRTLARCWSTH